MEIKKSILLSDSENQMVLEILPQKWESCIATVAQVFTCLPLQTQWVKRDTGIMCIIKDHPRKSYYCRLINLRERRVVWEQELYEEIILNQTSPFFLMFEADDSVVGISFVSAEECESVVRFVDVWKAKRARTQAVRLQRASKIDKSNTEKKPKSKKDKGKKKITADMIGAPTNFRQVAHFDNSTTWKMTLQDIPQNHPRSPTQPLMPQTDARMGSPLQSRKQTPPVPQQNPHYMRTNPQQYPQNVNSLAYPKVPQNFNRQRFPPNVNPQRGNNYIRTVPNNINPQMVSINAQQGYPMMINQQPSPTSQYRQHPYPNNQIPRSVPVTPNFHSPQSKPYNNQPCRPAPPPFIPSNPVAPPPPPPSMLVTSRVEPQLTPRDEVMKSITSGTHKLKTVDQKELTNRPMKTETSNSIATILQSRIDQINNANNPSSDDEFESESDDDEWMD